MSLKYHWKSSCDIIEISLKRRWNIIEMSLEYRCNIVEMSLEYRWNIVDISLTCRWNIVKYIAEDLSLHIQNPRTPCRRAALMHGVRGFVAWTFGRLWFTWLTLLCKEISNFYKGNPRTLCGEAAPMRGVQGFVALNPRTPCRRAALMRGVRGLVAAHTESSHSMQESSSHAWCARKWEFYKPAKIISLILNFASEQK